MDLLQALAAAITLGSALGATIAGFFAYRQKSLVALLRESNNDYKDRVDQLEKERVTDQREIENLQARIKSLENEKLIPLENLTKLIVEQHTQQLQSMDNLANVLTDVTKYISDTNKPRSRRKQNE